MHVIVVVVCLGKTIAMNNCLLVRTSHPASQEIGGTIRGIPSETPVQFRAECFIGQSRDTTLGLECLRRGRSL